MGRSLDGFIALLLGVFGAEGVFNGLGISEMGTGLLVNLDLQTVTV